MKLELITLAGVKVSDDVYEVLIPTPGGVIAILPGHERLVTLATNGVMSIRHKKTDSDDQMEHFATFGGVVEVSPTGLRILVDEADTADEIIEAEAQAAMDRALEFKASAKDQVELDKAKSAIDRSAVRLKVAGLRRRHR